MSVGHAAFRLSFGERTALVATSEWSGGQQPRTQAAAAAATAATAVKLATNLEAKISKMILRARAARRVSLDDDDRSIFAPPSGGRTYVEFCGRLVYAAITNFKCSLQNTFGLEELKKKAFDCKYCLLAHLQFLSGDDTRPTYENEMHRLRKEILQRDDDRR